MNQEKEFFQRFYALACEALNTKEDMKYLKQEFAYHKDDNPTGLDKESIKKIAAAAKAKASADNLKEKAKELIEIDNLIGELE